MEKSIEQSSKLCRRCGRKLISEQSKAIGMGETCFKKWAAENQHKKLFDLPSLQTSKNSI